MRERITSRNNPLVRRYASLSTRKGREAAGRILAEGVHLVREALAAGLACESIIVSEKGERLGEVAPLLTAAEGRGITVQPLADAAYAKISDLKSPEGIAVVLEPPLASLERLLARAPIRLLVAAGVQDPGNAGALIRTAEAAGASGALFLGAGVDLGHPRLLRGAQGSSLRLPAAAAPLAEGVAALVAAGVRILVAAAPHAIPYREADYGAPVALVLGAEGQGVPPELSAVASAHLAIPMTPPVESLNVAVAAGILLYTAREVWAP